MSRILHWKRILARKWVRECDSCGYCLLLGASSGADPVVRILWLGATEFSSFHVDKCVHPCDRVGDLHSTLVCMVCTINYLSHVCWYGAGNDEFVYGALCRASVQLLDSKTLWKTVIYTRSVSGACNGTHNPVRYCSYG